MLQRSLGPGLLLVLATAVISGVSTYVNGFAVAGTSSAAFVTARNATVALLIAPISLYAAKGRIGALSRRDLGALAIVGLVGGAIPFLLFFQGLQLAAEAHGTLTASFLYRTLFLMATVFGLVFLRERLRWPALLGAALLLGGNYLLMSIATPIWTDGSLYVLAATVLWAVEYTISKRLLATLPSGTVALGRMGFGALFLVGYLALIGQVASIGAFSSGEWDWILISGLLLAAFVGTWYTGLKRVELGTATSVLVLGFPISWALSLTLSGVPTTALQVLGAAVVVAGALLTVGIALMRSSWEWLLTRVGMRSGPLPSQDEGP